MARAEGGWPLKRDQVPSMSNPPTRVSAQGAPKTDSRGGDPEEPKETISGGDYFDDQAAVNTAPSAPTNEGDLYDCGDNIDEHAAVNSAPSAPTNEVFRTTAVTTLMTKPQ